jgi:hypothetical protein
MGISAPSTPTLPLIQENTQPWIDEARQKTPSIEKINQAAEAFLAYFHQFSPATDKASEPFALDEMITAPGISISRRELLGRLWIYASERLPKKLQRPAKESMVAELARFLVR